MSKAFTKESDGGDDEHDDEAYSRLPDGTKNYITPKGAEKLQSELKRLLNEDRPKLVKTIEWAASNGDRSENADYIYGKRKLREIDRRIRFLTKRLESAEVIDPSKQKSDTVLFGATVTVLDEEDKKHRYQIVGIDESDPKLGRISWMSPLARALLNSKKGDVVTFVAPKGEQDLEILDIEYL
ncbi:MAG: transcription elongation factor GreB [Bacteriovoracia bacterium]